MHQVINFPEALGRRQKNRSPRKVNLIYTKLCEKGAVRCMGNSETLDMGRGGCSFKVCHKLALGDLLEIELCFGTGAPLEIQGKVVWLKKEGSSETWLAGIEFIAGWISHLT